MNSTENLLFKLESLIYNPDAFIYKYFENIKGDVDLRRETLKQEIDECSDTVIEEIDKIKNEYMKTCTAIHYEPKETNKSMIVDEQLLEHKISLLGKKTYSFKFDEINIQQNFGHVVQKNIGGKLNK
jgi:hypothetical protein